MTDYDDIRVEALQGLRDVYDIELPDDFTIGDAGPAFVIGHRGVNYVLIARVLDHLFVECFGFDNYGRQCAHHIIDIERDP